MEFKIRGIKPGDYLFLQEWWRAISEEPPPENYLPVGSTFLCEVDDAAILSVVVWINNGPVAHVESFIGNPEFSGAMRREGTKVLLKHISQFAKDLGYERLFCMAPNPKLKCYYEDLGFHLTASNIFTFTKEL